MSQKSLSRWRHDRTGQMAATNPTALVISSVLCSLFVCVFVFSCFYKTFKAIFASGSVSTEEKIVVVVVVI